ncbi:hypothetical protein TNCV_1567431 [Trichonephila clavipes]|nr:hypothetical protein TNCV_1567431 [Trichonephila clavipes]
MRFAKAGTVDGYEWRCRNQSKDNRHDVVRSSSSGVIYDPSPANVINPQTATCLYNFHFAFDREKVQSAMACNERDPRFRGARNAFVAWKRQISSGWKNTL